MEEFQIETAQNVAIQQHVASLGDRMLAYLIDSLVIIGYFILLIFAINALDLDFGDSWVYVMVASLPAFMYYVLLETFWNGQTIGKNAMRIRVVKLDGSKPTFSNFLIRWLLRIVDVSLTTGGLAVLTILIRGNGQRVGDMAAGTTVISEKYKATIQDTILRDLPESYTPKFNQVTLFNDREMQTIKNLYDDARRNGNHNVILALYNRIIEVTQIQSELKPTELVDTVIKDYNFLTQQM